MLNSFKKLKILSAYKIFILILLLSLFVCVAYIIRQNQKISSLENNLQINLKTFQRNEYCRQTYKSEIEKDLENKYIVSDSLKEFWSINDIFFSPSENECFVDYEVRLFIDSKQHPTVYVLQKVSSDNIWSSTENYTEHLSSVKQLKQ